MKQVYSAATIVDAQIILDHLQAAGFKVKLSGQVLVGALGELPADISPSVWVLDNQDYLSARALVEELCMDLVNNNGTEQWSCQNCGENLDANFGQCWNCGQEREIKA